MAHPVTQKVYPTGSTNPNVSEYLVTCTLRPNQPHVEIVIPSGFVLELMNASLVSDRSDAPKAVVALVSKDRFVCLFVFHTDMRSLVMKCWVVYVRVFSSLSLCVFLLIGLGPGVEAPAIAICHLTPGKCENGEEKMSS